MKEAETEDHWVSISDVMAGLMVIFLFIAISYILNVRLKANEIIVYKNEIEALLDAYKSMHTALSDELYNEFEGTINKRRQFRTKWHGNLDKETLSIRFKQPFNQGDSSVPVSFRSVLIDFFPRYLSILSKPIYKSGISEIRIEGHTSSEWMTHVSSTEAYINNMELSQDRARNVLNYIFRINNPIIYSNREWLKNRLTSNGLSSSQLIIDLNSDLESPSNSYSTITRETELPFSTIFHLHRWIVDEIDNYQFKTQLSGKEVIKSANNELSFSNINRFTLERAINLIAEDKSESRRVEFRVVTKSEKLINEIEVLMNRFDNSEVYR